MKRERKPQKWVKPVLTVLTKDSSQNVLAGCKVVDVNNQTGCAKFTFKKYGSPQACGTNPPACNTPCGWTAVGTTCYNCGPGPQNWCEWFFCPTCTPVAS